MPRAEDQLTVAANTGSAGGGAGGSRSRPRRLRAAAILAAGAAVALAACSGQPASQHAATARPTSAPSRTTQPVLVARSEPWRLPAALSREVVLPQGSGLLIAGGLTAAQTSASGIFRLDPATGDVQSAGRLVAPVHDAAGAAIAGRDYLFGGGAATSTASIQAFRPPGAATDLGALPQPRSDLTATTIGNAVYIVGGYDGTAALPTVLATGDGQHFAKIAALPVPLRYPAVAALGTDLYVFGGEHAGSPSDVIQRVDTRAHTATVIGHLPEGLAAATAVTIDQTIYLAGGRTSSGVTDETLRFNPQSGTVTAAGALPYPVADAGSAVLGNTAYLVGGEGPTPVASVIALNVAQRPAPSTPTTTPPPAALSDAHPFDGRLLIADRGNNRLLLVDAAKTLSWSFPAPGRPAPPGGFYFPDDAFFTHHGTGIISNEEDNNAIVQIAFPSGTLQWQYGHPKVAGSAPGYLNQPDDAYLLADGQVTVADAKNCRILFLRSDKTVSHQLGTTGNCSHHPPTDLGYPNGDTPLANGNVLVSEIDGSYVTELTPTGSLVWSVHLPIAYPSDPQQIGPDRYLVADYAQPGGLYEFNRTGQILWSYHPSGGSAALNHPSLAEQLPGGYLAVNDDYRDRVVIIDPHSEQIIWQYGQTDAPGSGPGQLKTPDGFDLLAQDGTTPTHPYTG